MASKSTPNLSRTEDETASPSTGEGRTESRERSSPRPRTRQRGPRLNAIEPTRHQRTPPEKQSAGSDSAAAAEAGPAAPAASTSGSAPASPATGVSTTTDLHRAHSDPWTVPQSVRDRFVQDGQRFYFPDGAPAFRDFGRRLTTVSENTQVVHSLIEIAHSRGWTEVAVSGTERFRQEAWRQARMAGLSVRGYRPSDPEQAQLIRALARNLSMPVSRRTDTISADTQPSEPRAPTGAPAAGSAAGDAPKQRIAGKLVEHGRDTYRHAPKEEPSYFVRIETREGRREIWGKDLERAITQSLTQPQVGDEVVLQKTGRDLVTVKRMDWDDKGRLTGQKDVETHRNRWVIEKTDFFAERAQAAQVVRDSTIDPRTAVREHPELAGTYLNLRAAELAAERLRDPEDRRRFVALLRSALADEIERGEPLQPVRLRERAARLPERATREAELGPPR
jgi:hypothetical protein